MSNFCEQVHRLPGPWKPGGRSASRGIHGVLAGKNRRLFMEGLEYQASPTRGNRVLSDGCALRCSCAGVGALPRHRDGSGPSGDT